MSLCRIFVCTKKIIEQNKKLRGAPQLGPEPPSQHALHELQILQAFWGIRDRDQVALRLPAPPTLELPWRRGREPECPAEAIVPDTEEGLDEWIELNAKFSAEWPNITMKGETPTDADEWKDKPGKKDLLSSNAGPGS